MSPLLPTLLGCVCLATPALLSPVPSPSDALVDLATGDSNLHYSYGHAYGHHSYGHEGYHHSYGHHGYNDYGYGGGYGYGHPAPHHVGPAPHHAGPIHGAPLPLPPVHHAAGPGFPGHPGPHHVGAYGVDLVGPYSQHDGPFGPFGFYANFYHH